MGIGAGVVLIAIGLILALAVHVTVAGLDIQVIGWILVAAGALGLLLSFAFFRPRRRRVTVVDRVADPEDPRVAPRVRERTYDDGPY